MDLLPNEEQQAIAEAAGQFIANEVPLDRVRRIAQDRMTVDRGLWRDLASQSWFSLGVPESLGGIGYGLAEEALLLTEIGRAAIPGPIISTIMAGHLLAHEDRSMAEQVWHGETVVGWAEPVAKGSSAVDGETLTGNYLVIDGTDSDYLLVMDGEVTALVRTDDVHNLFPKPCIDESVTLADAEFANISAIVTSRNSKHRSVGLVLVAAMLTGLAEASLNMSTQYAVVREQFGRPIGAFQAVKHRCADMAVRAEAARSQSHYAALVAELGGADAGFQARAAKVVAGDAAIRNGEDNVQNHGAIGFTAENDAHLFLKRAWVYEHVLGSGMDNKRELATLPAAQ